jgi:hypothetical protein
MDTKSQLQKVAQMKSSANLVLNEIEMDDSDSVVSFQSTVPSQTGPPPRTDIPDFIFNNGMGRFGKSSFPPSPLTLIPTTNPVLRRRARRGIRVRRCIRPKGLRKGLETPSLVVELEDQAAGPAYQGGKGAGQGMCCWAFGRNDLLSRYHGAWAEVGAAQ